MIGFQTSSKHLGLQNSYFISTFNSHGFESSYYDVFTKSGFEKAHTFQNNLTVFFPLLKLLLGTIGMDGGQPQGPHGGGGGGTPFTFVDGANTLYSSSLQRSEKSKSHSCKARWLVSNNCSQWRSVSLFLMLDTTSPGIFKLLLVEPRSTSQRDCDFAKPKQKMSEFDRFAYRTNKSYIVYIIINFPFLDFTKLIIFVLALLIHTDEIRRYLYFSLNHKFQQ